MSDQFPRGLPEFYYLPISVAKLLTVTSLTTKVILETTKKIKKHYGIRTGKLTKVKQKKFEREEKIRETLLKNKSINSCYKINNGYDYLVEGVFKEITHVQHFIEELETKLDIEEKQVFYILEDLRKEDFLSSPEYIKLVGEHL